MSVKRTTTTTFVCDICGVSTDEAGYNLVTFLQPGDPRAVPRSADVCPDCMTLPISELAKALADPPPPQAYPGGYLGDGSLYPPGHPPMSAPMYTRQWHNRNRYPPGYPPYVPAPDDGDDGE